MELFNSILGWIKFFILIFIDFYCAEIIKNFNKKFIPSIYRWRWYTIYVCLRKCGYTIQRTWSIVGHSGKRCWAKLKFGRRNFWYIYACTSIIHSTISYTIEVVKFMCKMSLCRRKYTTYIYVYIPNIIYFFLWKDIKSFDSILISHQIKIIIPYDMSIRMKKYGTYLILFIFSHHPKIHIFFFYMFLYVRRT